MKKLIQTSAAFILLAVPAMAMTDEECAALWKRADSNSDGALNGAGGSLSGAHANVQPDYGC